MSRAYFQHQVEVRPEELDDLDHVNNAVYLTYAENCARAHSESYGLSLLAYRELGVVPVVRKHSIHYHQPALLGDTLTVSTQLTRLKGVRAIRINQVKRTTTGELLAEITTEWVWLDPESMLPTRVPSKLQEIFEIDQVKS